MRLRAPEIEVSPENPFGQDKMGRETAVDALTNILASTTDPLVIAVNAPWGYGKSTFLKMLGAHLSNNEFKLISFNAWESDFIDDPFVAILGDTETQLNDLRGRPNGSAQSRFDTAKKYGGKIIKAAIPAAVKLATAGILDLDTITEKTISDATEKLAQQQIDSYSEAKDSISKFRDEISKIAASLYDSESKLPLVFVIDELDRCRPTHAVRLLEIIKHFFSIERVAFVIAMDPEQLGHSVRTLYGQNMDVDGYLKRFFDLELNLPRPNPDAFLDAQFSKFGLDSFFAERGQGQNISDKDRVVEMFTNLFEALDFSFRERERTFALLSLAIRATSPNDHLHPLMLGSLIILKIKNSSLYRDFLSRKSTAEDVIKYFSTAPKGRKFTSSNYGVALEAELIGASTPNHELHEIAKQFNRKSQDESLSEDSRRRAEGISRVMQGKLFHDLYSSMDQVAAKIDLAPGEG